MEKTARHLRLLTETIEAVNSTLDLEEVLSLVASKVAEALGTDACFVYLYDERVDELVLRATYGTSVEEMTRRPRMRPGEGITGTAASERTPIMIPEGAHLDPRFKQFPNLHEEMYESILAVPITAKERLAGAVELLGETPATPCVYHLFPIRVDDRDRLARELAHRGVSTGVHYPVALPDQPAWKSLDRPVEEDVLATGEIRVEPGTELEQ